MQRPPFAAAHRIAAPSQRADRVYAWRADAPERVKYEGFVHRVEGNTLLLLFSRKFHEASRM